MRQVLGRGKGNVDFRVLHGAEDGHRKPSPRLKDDGPMLIPKRMMTVVVPDDAVPKVVETIIQANQTGQARRRQDLRPARQRNRSASAPANPAKRRSANSRHHPLTNPFYYG